MVGKGGNKEEEERMQGGDAGIGKGKRKREGGKREDGKGGRPRSHF